MPVRPLASAKIHRCAATCCSAVPTVSLPPPAWFEAENAPWACVHDTTPRVLASTEHCATCDRWKPRLHPGIGQR
jgi:hypothetical protein